MNDNGLSFLALLNQDKTTLQGFINYCEIMNFMLENYTGSDLSIFEEPLSNFDLTHHNLFPTYQKLVMARDTDTLFSVLKKMRDNRVSCIPIERQLSPSDQHSTRTVGLAFLSDIMFLLRLPNFYKYLDEPVLAFVTDLNGLDEDFHQQEEPSQPCQDGEATDAHESPDRRAQSNAQYMQVGGGGFKLGEVEESDEEGDVTVVKGVATSGAQELQIIQEDLMVVVPGGGT